MKIEKVLNKLVPDEKEERLRREAITKLETELMFIDENNFNYNKMDTEAIIVEANRLESIRLEKYKKDREFEIEQAELLLKKEKELYFSIHLEVLENSDFDVKLAKPKKDLITAVEW